MCEHIGFMSLFYYIIYFLYTYVLVSSLFMPSIFRLLNLHITVYCFHTSLITVCVCVCVCVLFHPLQQGLLPPDGGGGNGPSSHSIFTHSLLHAGQSVSLTALHTPPLSALFVFLKSGDMKTISKEW